MNLSRTQLNNLTEIIKNDYGIELNEEQAVAFGSSLLKLSRLASIALARADSNLSVQAREIPLLEANTSK